MVYYFSDNIRRVVKQSTVDGCVVRKRSKKELWSPALELEAEVTSARDTSGTELMSIEAYIFKPQNTIINVFSQFHCGSRVVDANVKQTPEMQLRNGRFA
jgi:hypothetical protein